mmetsp:Transcript_13293/g.34086  ORF Transcript_13293/g.34086 Transcript_13293/m.34086 type:complete len:310 (+) Transcript_13293:37-966(+)
MADNQTGSSWMGQLGLGAGADAPMAPLAPLAPSLNVPLASPEMAEFRTPPAPAPMTDKQSANSWMDQLGLGGGADKAPPPSLNKPLPPLEKPLTTDDLLEGNKLMAKVIRDSESSWATLRQLLDRGDCETVVEGNVAEYHSSARMEAARKLVMNHVAVLNDITNPMPLTQESLQRVPRRSVLYVDQGMREVARRLIGRRKGSPEALLLDSTLEVKLDPANQDMVRAWQMMALYLKSRLQSEPEQMPMRTPDMSSVAGKAMRAVLQEVGVGMSFSGGVGPGTILVNAMEGSNQSIVVTSGEAKGGCCAIM